MAVKASDFINVLSEQRVGYRGEFKFPELFKPTRIVGEGEEARNSGDKFGNAVSISGDLAVVGAPSQAFDDNGQNELLDAGRVFVYRRTLDAWEFAYDISAPVATRGEDRMFGFSVSLNGSTLVVGSPKAGGAAYIYNVSSGSATLEATLRPSEVEIDDDYGYQVSAQPNVVYVGAPLHGKNLEGVEDAAGAGAIWAYERDSNGDWISTKIIAGNNERNRDDHFGYSVAAHRNTLVIGTPNYSYGVGGTNKLVNAGGVFIYSWQVDHWVYAGIIFAPDRLAHANFGSSVSIHETTIVVGAKNANGNGLAYVFERNDVGTWDNTQTFAPAVIELDADYETAPEQTYLVNAEFGHSVSVYGNNIVVGAPGQIAPEFTSVDTNVTPHTWQATPIANHGLGYLYVREGGTWTLVRQLAGDFNPNSKVYAGRKGESVSAADDIVVVGAPLTDHAVGTEAGSIDVYRKDTLGWGYERSLRAFFNERAANDHFATSFAYNDRFVAIGAPGQSFDGSRYTANSGAVYVWERLGTELTFSHKIPAPVEVTANGNFGRLVRLSANRLFINADNISGSAVGRIYYCDLTAGKFAITGHVQVTNGSTPIKLTTLAVTDTTIVAADSKFAITLSDTSTGEHGSAWSWIYDAGTFANETVILPAGQKIKESQFGSSLALQNNILVVGAANHSLNSSDQDPKAGAGAAFVYALSGATWTQIDKLAGPNNQRSPNDYMGYSVSGDGNWMAVGVPGGRFDETFSGAITNAGAVYLYRSIEGAWVFNRVLVAPTRGANNYFGFAVSLSVVNRNIAEDMSTLVVGAPGEDKKSGSTTWGAGRSYIWERIGTTWTFKATLDTSGTNNSRFGWDVKVNNNRMIIGAPASDRNKSNAATPLVSNAGAAHIYELENGSWVYKTKLTQDDLGGRNIDTYFGFSVDIRDSLAVVSTPFDKFDTNGLNSLDGAGSACVFQRKTQIGQGSTWVPDYKIAGTPQDRNSGDQFGASIATTDSHVVIGTPTNSLDDKASNFLEGAGAAYVYNWVDGNLVFLQKLVAFETRDAGMNFGSTVAISNTHIAIAAPNYKRDVSGTITTFNIGKVYLYRFDNGRFVADRTFMPRSPDGVGFNVEYGKTLSLSHLILAVGSPSLRLDASGQNSFTNCGAVDIYRTLPDGWSYETTLVPNDRRQNINFGKSITIKDNIVIVGGNADQNSFPGDTSNQIIGGGAAWVFTYEGDTWVYQHKLARGGADRLATDGYGQSVALDGDTLVVGAPSYQWGNNVKRSILNSGAVFVFKYINGTWAFSQKIAAPDRVENMAFGTSISVKEDIMFVGAPDALNENNEVTGAVYAYRKSAQTPEQRTKSRVRKTQIFSGIGANQSFIVPENITSLNAYVWGAAGGAQSSTSIGGSGGFVQAKFDVTPGETLTVIVGKMPTAHAAGGGRSEILRSTTTLIVAGGGAGAHTNSNSYGIAGSGGGLLGENAFSGDNRTYPGLGGSQTTGGNIRYFATPPAGGYVGVAGSHKQGGSVNITESGFTTTQGGWPNGGNGAFHSVRNIAIGGGGDGWYGGASGGISSLSATNLFAFGGGGSSYLSPEVEGFTKTNKLGLIEHLKLSFEAQYLPGLGNDGCVIFEWFEEVSNDDWTFEAKLTPSGLDTTTPQKFGSVIATDGITLAVSAPNNRIKSDETTANYNVGAVCVFEHDGLVWKQTSLRLPFGDQGDSLNSSFGSSISVDGDFILVGAPTHNFDEFGEESKLRAGIVFVYKKIDGYWDDLQRLAPFGDVRFAGDQIGFKVAYYNDYVFVGAPGQSYDSNNSNKMTRAGAVYVWKWTDGILKMNQKLTAPATIRKNDSQFGYSLTVENDTLVVGANGTWFGDSTFKVGAVVTYNLENEIWVRKNVLTPATNLIQPNAQFGFDTALTADAQTLIVGAPGISKTGSININRNTLALNVRPQAIPFDVDGDMTIELIVDTGVYSSTTGRLMFELPRIAALGGMALNLYRPAQTTTLQVTFTNATSGATITNITSGVVNNSQVHVGIVKKGTEYSVYFDGVKASRVFNSDLTCNVLNRTVNLTSPTNTSDVAMSTVCSYMRISRNAKDLTIPANRVKNNNIDDDTYLLHTFDNFPNGWNDLTGNFTGKNTGVGSIWFTDDPTNPSELPLGGGAIAYTKGTEGWEFVKIISPASPNMSSTDKFGTSVDINDNLMVIGAPNHSFDQNESISASQNKPNAGAAWVFENIEGNWVEQQKLASWSDELGDNDRTGDILARSPDGMRIAVASVNHSNDAEGNFYLDNAGAVYVWIWNSATSKWLIEQKIVASNRTTNANFGSSIALSDDTLVIGAEGGTSGDVIGGSAYVYKFDSTPGKKYPWVFETQLLPTNIPLIAGAKFGKSVAINGSNEVLVGAPSHSNDAAGNAVIGAGVAYYFKQIAPGQWNNIQSFVAGSTNGNNTIPVTRTTNANFGSSVSCAGNDIMIGASGTRHDSSGVDIGSSSAIAGVVYVLTRPDNSSNFVQTQILDASTDLLISGARYGASTSASGNLIAVGAPSSPYNTNGTAYIPNAGTVSIWSNETTAWTLVQTLDITVDNVGTRSENAYYGASVLLRGDTLFVGVPGLTVDGTANKGQVITYKWNGTKFVFETIINSNNTNLNLTSNIGAFGSSLDFDGSTLIVGAPRTPSTTGSAEYGRVYIFENDGSAWNQIFTYGDTYSNVTARNLGYSVAINGDIAVAGAPGNTSTVNGGNTAAIFHKINGTWAYVDRVSAQRPTKVNDAFGTNYIFTNSGTLFVTSPTSRFDNLNRDVGLNAGAVYVFDVIETGTVFKQKLTPTGTGNHNSNDAFGTGISYDESTSRLFVGSPNHSVAGAVYEFERKADGMWYTFDKIVPGGSNPNVTSGFGTTIVAKNGILLVGAPKHGFDTDNVSVTGAGAIYLFKRDTDNMTFKQKILAPNRTTNAAFGTTFDFDNGILAVGVQAYSSDEYGNLNWANYGIAHMFKLEGLDGLQVGLVGGNPSVPATVGIKTQNGLFDGVSVLTSGAGYLGNPDVEFTLDGFEAHALLAPTSVRKLNLTNAGIGQPTVSIINHPKDTTGSGATAEYIIQEQSIVSVDIDDAGSGYTSVPTVSASSGNNVSLLAILAATGIGTINVDNSGTGYRSIPSVTISAPQSGTTATAKASMSLETVRVKSTVLGVIGEQYEIEFDIRNAIIEVSSVDVSGNIDGFIIIDAGEFTTISSFDDVIATPIVPELDYGNITDSTTENENYGSVTDSVTSDDNYGTLTISDINVDIDAIVTKVSIINAGQGYRTLPIINIDGTATATILLAPTTVESVEVINGGTDVDSNTTISFAGGNPIRTATATAVISSGAGATLVLTNGGSGYTMTPSVVFSDPAFQAVAELNPTTLASVVMDEANNDLPLDGAFTLARSLTAPYSEVQRNQALGSAIAGYDDVVVVGAPTNLTSTTAGVSEYGRVFVYDMKTVSPERTNVVSIDGYLDGSSVIDDITDSFTFNAWVKSDIVDRMQNMGTIFSINNMNRENFFEPTVYTTTGNITVPAGVNWVYFSAWGSGSNTANISGGFARGKIPVISGDVIAVTVAGANANASTIITKNGSSVVSIASGASTSATNVIDSTVILDTYKIVTNNLPIPMNIASKLRTPYRADNFYNGTAGKTGQAGLVALHVGETENANAHFLRVTNDGEITVSGDNQYIIGGTTSEIDDTWFNITYAYAAGSLTVYKGTTKIFDTVVTKPIAASSMLAIGAMFAERNTTEPTINGFVGQMSDIAIWNTKLTNADVADVISNGASNVKPTNLKALWYKN